MELFLAGLDRLMGDRTSGDATPTDSVGYWRRRVLDVAVTVGLILGAISVVPGVIRAALEANYVLLVADVTVLGIAVFVLLGRRIPYRLRAGLLVFAAFAIGLVQLVTSGLDTPAPLWLFAAPVMAAILFDLWTALALVGLVGVTMLGQLVLGRVGLLPAGLAGAVGSPRWVEVATDLVLLATVVPLFVGVLLEGLRTSFDRVRRVTDDLKAEGSRLLRVNRELEQEVMRRRQAEEERAWLTTAMEQAADAVAILELDGRIRYVNRSFVRMFGRDRLDLVGADIERVGLFSDHDTAARVMGTLDRGEVWVGRLAAERAGTTWHAQASFSTLRDQAGQPSHRLAVIRDVSREAELELQLQQAQKMKAMGTFAGGIAHDFNNLLVPILGTAELLAGQADGEVRDQLADIARSARRGRE
ncbi:MAG: PAS domain S-box protein, partial [Gemmatimonadota bacterium]